MSAPTFQGNVCKRGHDGVRYAAGSCVTCVRIQRDAWQATFPEKRKALKAKYRAANRERTNREATNRYAANPEKYRAVQSRYRKSHPDKVRQHTQSRRARILSSPGNGITALEARALHAASLGVCAYCNERKPLTLDHIDPLSLGGAHDVANAVAVCFPCNASKNNTPLLVWLAWKRVERG